MMGTYNRPEMILQSIESVSIQDWKDKELIIVNDYSKNLTKEIVEKHKSKIIKS